MNRFVKDNLLFILVLSIAGAGVLVLLLFSILSYVEMEERISDIEKLRSQITKLVSQKPAPVDGNKKPIKKDIASYKKALVNYRKIFARPMDVAGQAFIDTLREVNPQKDDDGKIVHITKEKFVDSFLEMWNNSGENNYAQKNFAFRTFRRRFTNWNMAKEEFKKTAVRLKATTEPIDDDNAEAIILSALGIPRRMEDNPEKMERFMRNFQGALAKMMSNMKFEPQVAWFGFVPDAAEIQKNFTTPAEQYPLLVRAWDIIGDIVSRMVDSKVEFFSGLNYRNVPASGEIAAVQGIRGEENGSFVKYRYRLDVAGKISNIRRLVANLDNGYKENRFYIVRSIALYASHDGANEIFIKADENANLELGLDNGAKPQEEGEQIVRRGRRGRRGRRSVEPDQSKLKAQAAQREAERKLLEMRKEEKSNYPYYERIGYGQVLIGNFDTCRAVIDFDYILYKK